MRFAEPVRQNREHVVTKTDSILLSSAFLLPDTSAAWATTPAEIKTAIEAVMSGVGLRRQGAGV